MITFAQAHRRQVLGSTAAAFAGFVASGACAKNVQGWQDPAKVGSQSAPKTTLVADPEGMLDLPEGFSYRVISRLGDEMDDGLKVPDAADGMGCFALPNGDIALVRKSPGAMTPVREGTLGHILPLGRRSTTHCRCQCNCTYSGWSTVDRRMERVWGSGPRGYLCTAGGRWH